MKKASEEDIQKTKESIRKHGGIKYIEKAIMEIL
jgi:hypothetical protein